MSETGKFLDRWSRRKREAADHSARDKSSDTASPSSVTEAKEPAAELEFDPASLPPIESITAESDIRPFLKPGVPAELTRAALRRVWSADPAIRDFIGLIENPWNFNDPHGVPGFGPMPAGENIASLLAQSIGALVREQTDAPQQTELAQRNSEQNPPLTVISEPPQALPHDQAVLFEGVATQGNDSVQCSKNDAATRKVPDEAKETSPSRRRGHGSALPK